MKSVKKNKKDFRKKNKGKIINLINAVNVFFESFLEKLNYRKKINGMLRSMFKL